MSLKGVKMDSREKERQISRCLVLHTHTHTHVIIHFYDRKSQEGPLGERKGQIGEVRRATEG